MSDPIQKVFIESDWDDDITARHQRDQYAAQLQSDGWLCHRKTLYRVTDGMPVYLVEAYLEQSDSDRQSTSKPEPASKQLIRRNSDSKTRRVPEFETR